MPEKIKVFVDTDHAGCAITRKSTTGMAIKLGQHYEFSSESSAALIVGRDALIAAPGKADHGGTVFEPSLSKTPGVHVQEKENGQTYDWWRRIRRR